MARNAKDRRQLTAWHGTQRTEDNWQHGTERKGQKTTDSMARNAKDRRQLAAWHGIAKNR